MMVSERALALAGELGADLAEARYDQVRQDLMSTTDIGDAHLIYAKILGLETALKAYHEGGFLALHGAVALCLEAERHMGQLLSEIPRQPGTRTDLTSLQGGGRFYSAVLTELGISESTALRWRQLARVTESCFHYWLQHTKWFSR